MDIFIRNVVWPDQRICRPGKTVKPVVSISKSAGIVLAVAIFVAILCLPRVAVAAEEFSQHEAHEHGVAHLNVAFTGSEIVLEFVSPAANIVGFEHAPSNPAEQTAYNDAVRRLEEGVSLFQFPSEAECELAGASVTADFGSEDHGKELDGGHGDEHGSHDTHSDFRAEYRFKAGRPDKLRHLDVLLLQSFPSIEHVEVQLLTPSTQTALELTSENIGIDL